MGYISNKLVEITENVINILPIGIHIDDRYDIIFDEVMLFIMDNGDMINDSAVSIAKAYTKEYNTKNATNIKIE